jgi:hypothetical protein
MHQMRKTDLNLLFNLQYNINQQWCKGNNNWHKTIIKETQSNTNFYIKPNKNQTITHKFYNLVTFTINLYFSKIYYDMSFHNHILNTANNIEK